MDTLTRTSQKFELNIIVQTTSFTTLINASKTFTNVFLKIKTC